MRPKKVEDGDFLVGRRYMRFFQTEGRVPQSHQLNNSVLVRAVLLNYHRGQARASDAHSHMLIPGYHLNYLTYAIVLTLCFASGAFWQECPRYNAHVVIRVVVGSTAGIVLERILDSREIRS